MPGGFKVATHNLQFNLGREKWAEDLKKSNVGDVTFYCEVGGRGQEPAIRGNALAAEQERGMFIPESSNNAISWRKDSFKALPDEQGVVEVHKRHPTSRFDPGRDFVGVGLMHRATGNRVLAIGVHPVAAYSNSEKGVKKNLADWKDWAATQYWLDVVGFTAEQMSRDFYDVIVLGGDYNAHLDNDKQWYYPANILRSLYVLNREAPGIDHISVTKDSAVILKNRGRIQAHTDHPIVVQGLEFQ